MEVMEGFKRHLGKSKSFRLWIGWRWRRCLQVRESWGCEVEICPGLNANSKITKFTNVCGVPTEWQLRKQQKFAMLEVTQEEGAQTFSKLLLEARSFSTHTSKTKLCVWMNCQILRKSTYRQLGLALWEPVEISELRGGLLFRSLRTSRLGGFCSRLISCASKIRARKNPREHLLRSLPISLFNFRSQHIYLNPKLRFKR